MNKILIMGRLGADAETRFTAGGQKVTSFRAAVNSRRGGKDETAWYRVTIWGDRFDKLLPYLKKGSALIVSGELRAEIYMDKEGKPQISLEVTADSINFNPFGSGTSESGQQQPQQQNQAPFQGNPAPQYGQAPSYAQTQADEDALPF